MLAFVVRFLLNVCLNFRDKKKSIVKYEWNKFYLRKKILVTERKARLDILKIFLNLLYFLIAMFISRMRKLHAILVNRKQRRSALISADRYNFAALGFLIVTLRQVQQGNDHR